MLRGMLQGSIKGEITHVYSRTKELSTLPFYDLHGRVSLQMTSQVSIEKGKT